jgi:ribosomal protein S18 acetylase RimI-like enzyme
MNELPAFDLKNISFRFATQNDAIALSELAQQTFYEAFAAFNTREDMLLYSSGAFSLPRMKEELLEEHSVFILVYHIVELIGYARLKTNSHSEEIQETPTMEIERFYIRATYIDKHIGGLLMQECLRYASLQGIVTVWLGVWEHNTRALAFYKKWGFIEYGSHPFLLGKDLQTDLLMKRVMNSDLPQRH